MLYDDDEYMLGAMSIDEDQWAMGAPARRRAAPRRNPHNLMILPITLPIYTFALADGVNVKTGNVTPQFPFAGQQLLATIIRNGTSAANAFPLLNQLFVGPTPIIQTTPGPPLDSYRFDAVRNNFRLPPTGLGQLYRGDVNLSQALTTTDTIQVILQLNGVAKLSPGYVVRG
jgi:hypothetical protein